MSESTKQTSSRARVLFEQIINAPDPIQMIEGMARDHWTEDGILEFKTPGDEKSQKQNWSQALSGFANTEGGVIVWGIKTRRDQSGDGSGRPVDAADSCDPVNHPTALAQMLRDVELQAVIERIPGVEIKSFSTPLTNRGYVVCYVPQGVHKPYRAEMEPQHQYWQRIGDKFEIIPHPLLRSLFFPRPAASLVLLPSKSQRGFTLYLANNGNATAEEIYVSVEYNQRTVVAGPGFRGFEIHQPIEGIDGWSCAVGTPIHPGQQRRLSVITWQADRVGDETEIRVAIYARDQEPIYALLKVKPEEIGIEECSRDDFKTIGSSINAFRVHYRG